MAILIARYWAIKSEDETAPEDKKSQLQQEQSLS